MDKARNVRRGASGLSNTNKRRHKLFGVFTAAIRGDLQLSEKSKKEKVRSLSSVGRALTSSQHFEMGCHVSEKQALDPSSTIIASNKRFQIPKNNFLNDCNGVHHASVPRKLRSAMKKRSRESILLDSEKVNHKMNGIESPEKGSVKKSKKQGIGADWSPREGVSGPITKDEEEVVETLYALAGMFPNKGSNHNSRELHGESLQENSSVLQYLEENPNAALEASAPTQDVSPCPERSPREASKISSSNETAGQEQPDLSERATFSMASHSTTPTIHLQTMPMMVKCENSNKVALHEFELCLAMGQSRISQIESKPDVEFEAARDVDCMQEQKIIKKQKENEVLALWPGLSPVASAGQAFLQSSSAKAPDWMEAAICASKQDLMKSCSSSGKSRKRSWKRCAAHVHISHIIRSLEVPKRHVIKEPELYECHQMNEGTNCGVLLEVHNLNGMRNGVISATVRDPHESKNGILQQQCHYRDISQAAPIHGGYGPQKQGFNFLSLTAESNGLKVDNSYNKIGTRLEQWSKLHVPYLQSLAQQHELVPVPMPQSQYSSTSYLDQLSVPGPQARLQQPNYYGSPLCGTHYNSTVSNKQQFQSFSGVLQACQGAVNCKIMRSQYPDWQSGRHDSFAVSPCAQAILPRSLASQEIFGSMITSISGQQQQQQQQLINPVKYKWARPSSPFCM
ncbi:uncharacterized protein LOC133300326 isoform X2 [Gastrolobium bilobum]|uniref:uncharacterized protein LOC133300326 isoform X2 n=1 Tax=Gastrolobium bilobum TaxID=150636 RepID=UPI002AAF50B9|nr:uncharacterized protein LOC133300326 isoform X2 [Gastrolobium bilobum]